MREMRANRGEKERIIQKNECVIKLDFNLLHKVYGHARDLNLICDCYKERSDLKEPLY